MAMIQAPQSPLEQPPGRAAHEDEVEFVGGLGTMPEQAAAEAAPATDETTARQAPLALRPPKGVAVVGCGGVGSWIAYFLALAGVRPLWLFDPDMVEIHNLNRLPLSKADIGKRKSEALASMLKHRLGDETSAIPMAAFTAELADSIRLYEEVQMLVCSTDTWTSRKLCYDWCQSTARHDETYRILAIPFVRYIEAAAEGEIGSITDSPAEFATADEAAPGYASVPVWIGPAAAAAVMACAYILHGSVPEHRVLRFGWDAEMQRPVFTNISTVQRRDTARRPTRRRAA